MKSLVCVLAACLLVLAPISANAALPPEYQRLVEIRAVLDAVQPILEEIGEITAVAFVTFDVYEVRSDRCRVTAHIVDTPTPSILVGPRQFIVTLGKIACAAP